MFLLTTEVRPQWGQQRQTCFLKSFWLSTKLAQFEGLPYELTRKLLVSEPFCMVMRTVMVMSFQMLFCLSISKKCSIKRLLIGHNQIRTHYLSKRTRAHSTTGGRMTTISFSKINTWMSCFTETWRHTNLFYIFPTAKPLFALNKYLFIIDDLKSTCVDPRPRPSQVIVQNISSVVPFDRPSSDKEVMLLMAARKLVGRTIWRQFGVITDCVSSSRRFSGGCGAGGELHHHSHLFSNLYFEN